jgi:hypothetical protein
LTGIAEKACWDLVATDEIYTTVVWDLKGNATKDQL